MTNYHDIVCPECRREITTLIRHEIYTVYDYDLFSESGYLPADRRWIAYDSHEHFEGCDFYCPECGCLITDQVEAWVGLETN